MIFVKQTNKQKTGKIWYRSNHILEIVHISGNYILVDILRNIIIV